MILINPYFYMAGLGIFGGIFVSFVLVWIAKDFPK